MNGYELDPAALAKASPLPLTIVENDTDLYWDFALSLYVEVERNNEAGRDTVVILPVGPVFQYRRLVSLCLKRPLDLSRLHCFFMDEYCADDGALIDAASPLSFRGFIARELAGAMPAGMKLNREHIHFPDPREPAACDRLMEELGGVGTCYAGVGINGHLAFNEPPEAGIVISAEEFSALPTRVVTLSRETVAINSNTALRGAFERVPRRAVTVGMKQILSAARVRLYLNRPWQGAVIRKLLFGEISPSFPATLLRKHGNVQVVVTATVAERPEFALK